MVARLEGRTSIRSQDSQAPLSIEREHKVMKKSLALLIMLCTAVPLFAQSKTRYLISMRRSPAVSSMRLVHDAGEAVAHNVRTFRSVDFIAADLTDAEAAA